MNFDVFFDLKKLTKNFLYFLVFLVPLFFIPFGLHYFTATKTFFFILFTQILLVLFLFALLKNRFIWPSRNFILTTFTFFVSTQILSSILGFFPSFSFWSNAARSDGILTLIHIFLFLLIGLAVLRSKEDFHDLLLVSVTSSFLLTISVYVSSAGFNLWWVFRNLPGGLLSNDSYAGAYLIFNLFFASYLFCFSPSKYIKLFSIIFFGITLFSPIFFNFDIWLGEISFFDLIQNKTLWLGNARGASLGLYIGLVFSILIFVYFNSEKIWQKKIFLFFLFFYSLFLFVGLFLAFSPGNQINKNFIKETGGFRSIYQNQAISGFKERPLLGLGAGNFYVLNNKYYNPVILSPGYSLSDTYTDKAHNFIFDFLATSGLLGLFSYLFLIISALYLLLRKSFVDKKVKAIFVGLVLAFLFQNLFFFDFVLSYLMPAVFLIGVFILTRAETQAQIEKKKPLFTSFVFKRMLVFIILCLFVFNVYYFVYAPLKYYFFNFFYYQKTPEERIALRTTPFLPLKFGQLFDSEEYASWVYFYYLSRIDLIKENQEKLNLNIYIQDLDNTISMVKGYQKPFESIYWSLTALYRLYDVRYLILEDQYSLYKMAQYSKRQIELSPNDPRGYINYSKTFFYRKEYNQAFQILSQEVNRFPFYADVHQIMIEIAVRIDNPELLEATIKEAEKNLPAVDFRAFAR